MLSCAEAYHRLRLRLHSAGRGGGSFALGVGVFASSATVRFPYFMSDATSSTKG